MSDVIDFLFDSPRPVFRNARRPDNKLAPWRLAVDSKCPPSTIRPSMMPTASGLLSCPARGYSATTRWSVVLCAGDECVTPRVAVWLVAVNADGVFSIPGQDGPVEYRLESWAGRRVNAMARIDLHDLSTAEVHVFQHGRRLRPAGIAKMTGGADS